MRLFAAVAGLLAVGCVPRLYTEGTTELVTGVNWQLPTNGWDNAEPPDELVAEGLRVGETAPDLRVIDQHGDEVSLWQFYGDVVLLDISTMWCAPCQDLAQDTQSTSDHFAEDGFTYVTVLQQDVEGLEPSIEDLNLWADGFGIKSPVVSDSFGEHGTADAVINGQFPVVLIIDRSMGVAERVEDHSKGNIDAAIESQL